MKTRLPSNHTLLLIFLGAAACSEADRPDAQTDAGRADATSSSDAGRADATSSSDAGRADGHADGGTPDAGAVIDAGGGDSGSPGEEGLPILARTPRTAFDCRVTRGPTNHLPRHWTYSGQALKANRAGQHFISRVEWVSDDPLQPSAPEFLISTLDLDGTFGANPAKPSTFDPRSIGVSALATRGDGLAVVWVEGEGLFFAALDAAGAIVVQKKPLAGLRIEVSSSLKLVEGSNSFGLVWQEPENGPVRFVGLDAGGALISAPVVITQQQGFLRPAVTLAPAGDGFAIAFQRTTAQRSHVWFKTVAADGAERQAPVRLSSTDRDGIHAGGASGFSASGIALLPVNGGFVVAWNETDQGDIATGAGASSIVRLARINAQGQLASVAAPMRAKEVDIDEIEPVLFSLGSVAGVTWSRGTHIYACAGCMPDHRVDLVLFDPVDLVPVSNVARLPAAASGVLRKSASSSGSDILLAFHITFHVHFDPGTAALVCD